MELQVPKGSKYEKIILIECDFQNKYHERNTLFYNVKLFSYFAYARFRYNNNSFHNDIAHLKRETIENRCKI